MRPPPARQAIASGLLALVPALLAVNLLARPAEARVGRSLAESAAAARAAGVPAVTFAVRSDVVVMEIWRSYTGDDHRLGPSWSRAQADRLRAALAGKAALQSTTVELVSWASFAVPTFTYGDGTRVVYVAKPEARRIWMMVAGGAWSWRTPFAEVEATCEGWTLVKGKLTRRKPASW